MYSMLKRIVSLLFVAAVSSFIGCSDTDVLEYHRPGCDCVQITEPLLGIASEEFWQEMTTTADEQCEALSAALIGIWEGLGDNSDRRFILRSEGQFTIQVLSSKGTWVVSDEGKYWIEYVTHQDMLRTELHMTSDILDDYAVRYRFEGEVLHFEEPSDAEPTMRFVKIGDVEE